MVMSVAMLRLILTIILRFREEVISVRFRRRFSRHRRGRGRYRMHSSRRRRGSRGVRRLRIGYRM